MKIATKNFIIGICLLLLLSTTAYGQGNKEQNKSNKIAQVQSVAKIPNKSNTMANKILSVAGLIMRAISSSYPYLYDGRGSELFDLIANGGQNMFDEGNKVSYGVAFENLTMIKYNQTYRGKGFQFYSTSSHPFFAGMWIEGSEVSQNYTIRVQSKIGGDGKGSVKTYGNKYLRIGVFDISYTVFQIFATESPTIAKVFFSISSRRLWNSVPQKSFSFFTERTADNEISTAASLNGNPQRVLFGYMLLSKFPSLSISEKEINSVMSIAAKSLKGLKGLFTNGCRQKRRKCDPNAFCKNNGNKYSCICKNGYVGNGKECVQDILEVGCYTSHMTVEAPAKVFTAQRIALSRLHLRDPSCGGTVLEGNKDSWIFKIPFLESSCGTFIEMKDGKYKYYNTLTNINDDGKFKGAAYSRTFSCIYDKNLIDQREEHEDDNHGDHEDDHDRDNEEDGTADLPEPGENKFVLVRMNLYTDESFSEVETKNKFTASDYFHVKFDLGNNLENENLVIKKCWVTPNSDVNDASSYSLIEQGCPTEEVKKAVQIIKSGDGSTASFESRVFAIVDFSTVYMHCSLYICSSTFGRNCKPQCNAPVKRSINNFESKSKRELPIGADDETVSLGPFFRERDQKSVLTEVGLTLIILVVVGVVMAMIAFAFFRFRSSSVTSDERDIGVVTFTNEATTSG